MQAFVFTADTRPCYHFLDHNSAKPSWFSFEPPSLFVPLKFHIHTCWSEQEGGGAIACSEADCITCNEIPHLSIEAALGMSLMTSSERLSCDVNYWLPARRIYSKITFIVILFFLIRATNRPSYLLLKIIYPGAAITRLACCC